MNGLYGAAKITKPTRSDPMACRFYDNEVLHFRGVSSAIECVAVKEVNVLNGGEGEHEYYERFRSLYPQNPFVMWLSAAPLEYQRAFVLDVMPPSLGLTNDHLLDMEQWMDTHPRMLFLDWDRTLTVVEGFAIPAKPWIPPVNTIEWKTGYVQYLVGGTDRMQRLQDMGTRLRAHDIQLFIITHNPAAAAIDPWKRYFFLTLIKVLFPWFRSKDLLASRMIPCTATQSPKAVLISRYVLDPSSTLPSVHLTT